MTAPYRTPEASLRAEVERLTRELATMRSPAPPRRRAAWSTGDTLSAPIVIGGYPVGVMVTCAGINTGNVWAFVAALLLGLAWWMLALRWCSKDGAP